MNDNDAPVMGHAGGILSLLDEQNKLPKGSDKSLAQNIFQTLRKFKNLAEPKRAAGAKHVVRLIECHLGVYIS